MNAAEILEEVRSHGAELFLRDGKLVVRGSGAALPETLQAEIKGCKAELMIALGSPMEPTIASILADIRPYLPDALKRLPDGSLLVLVNWSIVHGWNRAAQQLPKGRSVE